MDTKTFTDCKEVVSSNISKVFYNKNTKEMFVKFRNGAVAGYAGVPSFTYSTLVTAPSVGSYFSRQVKGAFRGLNGDVNLVPEVYKPEDAAVVAVAEKSQPVSAYVQGHYATVDDKRFRVTVEKVTRDTFEVSAKSMEEAVANLDVDGKVVEVTWVARV